MTCPYRSVAPGRRSTAYPVEALNETFTPIVFSLVYMRFSRSAAVNPEIRILFSSVAGSIGVANWTLKPNLPASFAPSAGYVVATEGSAMVVNVAVRPSAVTPPCAPLRPFSSVTVYRVWTPRRSVGLNESTVWASFHESFPAGAAPVAALVMLKPPAADGSMGWLKPTSTCCHGPQ